MNILHKKLSYRSVLIGLAIIYTVGLVGLNVEATQSLFRQLTPLNLLLTSGFLFLFHPHKTPKFYLFTGLTMFLGFAVEVIGVNTGQPFGVYTYETTLGFKLLETPLMIGVNWWLLVYTCGIIAERSGAHVIVKAALAAALMVLIDFVIEPFAIRHHLWFWEGHSIPIQNYVAWFAIAFCLEFLFFRLVKKTVNPLALTVYCILFLFFLLDSVVGNW